MISLICDRTKRREASAVRVTALKSPEEMDMDMYNVVTVFAANYVEEFNKAQVNDDWNEQTYVRKDAQRIIREMRAIVDAVDLFNRYGMTVR